MKKIIPPLLLLVSTSAFAATDRFDYNPSDLGTPAEIEAMHGKVESFARKYCKARTQTLVRFQSCFEGVEEEILEKINDAKLNAYATDGVHTEDVAAI